MTRTLQRKVSGTGNSFGIVSKMQLPVGLHSTSVAGVHPHLQDFDNQGESSDFDILICTPIFFLPALRLRTTCEQYILYMDGMGHLKGYQIYTKYYVIRV